MELVQFSDARGFRDRSWPLLLGREAENNLMVGIVGRLAEGAGPGSVGGEGRPMFWAVEDRGRVEAAAVITPPHRLILTRASAQAVAFLAEELRGTGVELPGVVGPKRTADRFSALWSRQCARQARLTHALRIYQLDRVQPVATVAGRLPAGRQAGMEVAELKDFELVQQWDAAFCREAGVPVPAAPERLRGLLQAGEMFLWKAPQPVSMAVAVQPTPNGIRLSGVYTPPGHRRRGYATALVAALSQRLLDSGRKFCFLFADLANPTSNSIYERIGYEPVCDFQEYDFVRSERNGDAALGAGAGR